MAVKDFLPGREGELLRWSENFANRISADGAAVGISPLQAAQYAALHAEFAAAFVTANNPSTNSASAVVEKNIMKRQLVSGARLLAGIAQKFPATTNTQRSELNLTIRAPRASRIAPPVDVPVLVIVAAFGSTVRLRVTSHDHPSRRGKAAGIAGAALFSFIGDEPPTDRDDWRFQGHCTRPTHAISFPSATPPGTKVWLTAYWINPRLEGGPAAVPISAHLPGGAAMAA